MLAGAKQELATMYDLLCHLRSTAEIGRGQVVTKTKEVIRIKQQLRNANEKIQKLEEQPIMDFKHNQED